MKLSNLDLPNLVFDSAERLERHRNIWGILLALADELPVITES